MTTRNEERFANTPTWSEIVSRIRAQGPLLAANAARGEAERRVPEESIAALQEAGAFKVSVPKRYGGYELNLRAMLEVSAAIAELDGGASWVTTLSNVNSWTLGLFSSEAREEVWGQDPNARLAGVLAADGRARKVQGGYNISGRWHYASGIWHASWCTLGVLVEDDQGQIIDHASVLVPRSQCRVEDVWFVAGLRASGSNCVVVEDVFVPAHRVSSFGHVLTGEYLADHPDSPVYRGAVPSVLVMVLVGPQLGFGRAALEIVRSKAAKKAIPYTIFGKQTDSVAFQLQVAEAATQIDTAHLHAYRAADDIERYANLGELPDLVIRGRIRADAATAVQCINKALNTLVFAHGASSFAEANPLQRIWRDSNVGARHAAMLPQIGFEIYGKALLGVQEQITPLL